MLIRRIGYWVTEEHGIAEALKNQNTLATDFIRIEGFRGLRIGNRYHLRMTLLMLREGFGYVAESPSVVEDGQVMRRVHRAGFLDPTSLTGRLLDRAINPRAWELSLRTKRRALDRTNRKACPRGGRIIGE